MILFKLVRHTNQYQFAAVVMLATMTGLILVAAAYDFYNYWRYGE